MSTYASGPGCGNGCGSVRTVTGTEEFQLTVAGVDVQVSKPLPIEQLDALLANPMAGMVVM